MTEITDAIFCGMLRSAQNRPGSTSSRASRSASCSTSASFVAARFCANWCADRFASARRRSASATLASSATLRSSAAIWRRAWYIANSSGDSAASSSGDIAPSSSSRASRCAAGSDTSSTGISISAISGIGGGPKPGAYPTPEMASGGP